MTFWQIADLVAATVLTLSIAVFALRYGLGAPWWKSFEGLVIEGTMIAFTVVMANLLLRLYVDWPYYQQGMAVTMTIGAVFMVYQNVLLTRSRRRVARRNPGPPLVPETERGTIEAVWEGSISEVGRIIDWILANGGTARYECKEEGDCTGDPAKHHLRIELRR